MEAVWQGALAYARIMSTGEFLAVILAVIYVVLAAKENRWCWPAGILSSLLFTVLFFENELKFDMLLNAYYVLIGVYGWFSWSRQLSPAQQAPSGKEKAVSKLLPVRKLTAREWLVLPVAILLSLGLGWIAATYWQQGFWQTDFPYLDAATTVFAVWATWMVSVRILENWLFWIVIDAASIYLYIQKELYFTAVLFALYILIAVFGYFKWEKSYAAKNQ